MNVIVAIGNWADPGHAYDNESAVGGRIVRGRLMLSWSKPLDANILFNLTFALLLDGGLKLDQSLTIRRVV